eukprot:6015141-Amphidinium_carterae.1
MRDVCDPKGIGRLELPFFNCVTKCTGSSNYELAPQTQLPRYQIAHWLTRALSQGIRDISWVLEQKCCKHQPDCSTRSNPEPLCNSQTPRNPTSTGSNFQRSQLEFLSHKPESFPREANRRCCPWSGSDLATEKVEGH